MRSARFCVGEGVRGQAAGGDSGAGASGQGTDKNWEQIRCVSKRGGLFEGDLSLAQLRQSAGYVRLRQIFRGATYKRC